MKNVIDLLFVMYYVGGFSLIRCFAGNHKWMGFELTNMFTSTNDDDSKLFNRIFWWTLLLLPFWIIGVILFFLIGDYNHANNK